jgi:hypothetical protein
MITAETCNFSKLQLRDLNSSPKPGTAPPKEDRLRQKENQLLELLILNKEAMTAHERAADPSIIYFQF